MIERDAQPLANAFALAAFNRMRSQLSACSSEVHEMPKTSTLEAFRMDRFTYTLSEKVETTPWISGSSPERRNEEKDSPFRPFL